MSNRFKPGKQGRSLMELWVPILCWIALICPVIARSLRLAPGQGNIRLEFFWSQMYRLFNGISVQNAEIAFPLGGFALLFVALYFAVVVCIMQRRVVFMHCVCLFAHLFFRGLIDFRLFMTFFPMSIWYRCGSFCYWVWPGPGWRVAAVFGWFASVAAILLQSGLLVQMVFRKRRTRKPVETQCADESAGSDVRTRLPQQLSPPEADSVAMVKTSGFMKASLVLGSLFVVTSIVLFALFLPAMHSTNEQLHMLVCRNNLKQLSTACRTYLETHGENKYYPKLLDELYESGVISGPELLTCPSDKSPVRTPGGRLTSYECIFDLASDRLTDNVPVSQIAIWERKSIHRNRRNVVFVDTHTESVTEEKFQQLMEQLKASGVLTPADVK